MRNIMQVNFNSVSMFKQNYTTQRTPHTSFRAKPPLTAISTESFNSETAKKLYLKIKKYFQLIGDVGKVENVKILSENGHYYGNYARYLDGFNTDADIFMSISKNKEAANLTLNRKYSDPSKDRCILLSATFDKDGQMTDGRFPLEGLRYERTGANVRRIRRDKKIYLPVKGNDKAWEFSGRELLAGNNRVCANDDSTKGAFELFIEMARLRTSIYM